MIQNLNSQYSLPALQQTSSSFGISQSKFMLLDMLSSLSHPISSNQSNQQQSFPTNQSCQAQTNFEAILRQSEQQLDESKEMILQHPAFQSGQSDTQAEMLYSQIKCILSTPNKDDQNNQNQDCSESQAPTYPIKKSYFDLDDESRSTSAYSYSTKQSKQKQKQQQYNCTQIQHKTCKQTKEKKTRMRFTPYEDSVILKVISKDGLNWNKLHKELPCRNIKNIKNRYYSFLKKRGICSPPLNNEESINGDDNDNDNDKETEDNTEISPSNFNLSNEEDIISKNKSDSLIYPINQEPFHHHPSASKILDLAVTPVYPRTNEENSMSQLLNSFGSSEDFAKQGSPIQQYAANEMPMYMCDLYNFEPDSQQFTEEPLVQLYQPYQPQQDDFITYQKGEDHLNFEFPNIQFQTSQASKEDLEIQYFQAEIEQNNFLQQIDIIYQNQNDQQQEIQQQQCYNNDFTQTNTEAINVEPSLIVADSQKETEQIALKQMEISQLEQKIQYLKQMVQQTLNVQQQNFIQLE